MHSQSTSLITPPPSHQPTPLQAHFLPRLVSTLATTSNGGRPSPISSCASRLAVPRRSASMASALPPGSPQVPACTGAAVHTSCHRKGRRLQVLSAALLHTVQNTNVISSSAPKLFRLVRLRSSTSPPHLLGGAGRGGGEMVGWQGSAPAGRTHKHSTNALSTAWQWHLREQQASADLLGPGALATLCCCRRLPAAGPCRLLLLRAAAGTHVNEFGECQAQQNECSCAHSDTQADHTLGGWLQGLAVVYQKMARPPRAGDTCKRPGSLHRPCPAGEVQAPLHLSTGSTDGL